MERIGKRVREMREDERNGQKEEVVMHKRIGCKLYCTVQTFMQNIFANFIQNQRFCG